MKLHLAPIVLLSLLLLSGCASHSVPEPQDDCLASPCAEGAVRCAYSQIGAAYCCGGKSPSQGFDCSGLVYWAYRANGVNLPRISTDQAKAGVSVDLSEALPGDILVFKTSRGRGCHTGVYVGEGKFIHSPKPGATVRTDSLSLPYWSKRLVDVRRVSSES